VLTNSHHTSEALLRTIGSLPNLQTCWLATEEENVPSDTAATGGPPTLLFIGRQDAYFAKGQDTLVRVWPRVVAAIPDARLCLVGDGVALGRLRMLVEASPCFASFDLLGFVPETEMPAVWRKASALALLSSLEGFGLVIVEAMRFAKPVIASIQDAGCEVNIDGVTGYNVDRGDDDAIVSRILALLGDPDLAGRMGSAGRTRWNENFRTSQFALRFRAALAPLLAR
jgi:phosphatidylinositol alpha-1,6-mannosyltransferase